MVRPSERWNDREDGYANGSAGVFVSPTRLEERDGALYERPVERGEENAYAVELVRGVGTADRKDDALARFADERTAWEFANLFTRYLDRLQTPADAVMEIADRPIEAGERVSLPPIVEDESAEEALRTLLGDYAFRVDDVTAERR